MPALETIAGQLLEMAGEVLERRPVLSGHQQVKMLWHEAVGEEIEAVALAGYRERVEARSNDFA